MPERAQPAAADRPRAARAAALRARRAGPPRALLHALARLLPLHVPPAQPEGDVVEDVEVREERIALEDRVDLPLVRRRRRHVDPVEQDLAAVGPFEARDQTKRRRLAAARRAEQREELARLDLAGRCRRPRLRRRSPSAGRPGRWRRRAPSYLEGRDVVHRGSFLAALRDVELPVDERGQPDRDQRGEHHHGRERVQAQASSFRAPRSRS